MCVVNLDPYVVVWFSCVWATGYKQRQHLDAVVFGFCFYLI